VLLRAAIEKEEVDGNLDAAIEQYKHIIKIAARTGRSPRRRCSGSAAATRSAGPRRRARAYQQLIRDFGEQAKEVAVARQRLAALTAGAPARSGDSRLTIRGSRTSTCTPGRRPTGSTWHSLNGRPETSPFRMRPTGAIRMLTRTGRLSSPSNGAVLHVVP